MKKQLDLEAWTRKDHFNFFRQFEEPFFGVTVRVDCTRAYQYVKERSVSFFLYYLHCSLVAANELEPFRYRVNNNGVLIFDEVHASPTINRPDGTFGFGYLEYYSDFNEFAEKSSIAIAAVQQGRELFPEIPDQNVIHYSSLPWLDFSSLSHARRFIGGDSCPKISFGKMTEEGGKLYFPVSVHVHHALMDGYHVGKFIDRFQELMLG